METFYKEFLKLKIVLGVLSIVFLFTSGQAEARNCKKGKPCGNSCISQKDVCHKGAGDSTTSAEAPVVQAQRPDSVAPVAAPPAAAPPVAAPAAAAPVDSTPASQSPNPSMKNAKNCKAGKACGNTCIPKDAVCHI